MHRTLAERVQRRRAVPPLRQGPVPRRRRTDGRLAYVQDAYTISDRFPASQPFDLAQLRPRDSGLAHDSFNYIRNSVKIVMDAYDGTMSFYVSDPTDPLIRAYEGVFPGLFKPFERVPASSCAATSAGPRSSSTSRCAPSPATT